MSVLFYKATHLSITLEDKIMSASLGSSALSIISLFNLVVFELLRLVNQTLSSSKVIEQCCLKTCASLRDKSQSGLRPIMTSLYTSRVLLFFHLPHLTFNILVFGNTNFIIHILNSIPKFRRYRFNWDHHFSMILIYHMRQNNASAINDSYI